MADPISLRQRREFLRLASAGLALAIPGCASHPVKCEPDSAATQAPVECMPDASAMQDPVQLSRLDPVAMSRDVFLDAKTPGERWADVLARDRQALDSVVRFMVDEAEKVPRGLFIPFLAQLAYPQYRARGYFIDESDHFAEKTGISRALMAFLQRQYTWSHAYCTTASAWDPSAREMVMLRSLDWPGAPTLAPATRIHRFVRGGSAAFHSVGLTGMVGVLTGVKPGAFAIAINYAPLARSARPAADPTFLIRQILEDREVDSFAKAALVVSWWRPGASCFISLTGVSPGEGHVYEFGHGGPPVVRRMGDAGYLVQTNHFDDADPASPHATLNECTKAAVKVLPPVPADCFCADLVGTSRLRRHLAEERLATITRAPGGKGFDDEAHSLWSTVPILNFETVHFAILRPSRRAVSACSVWTTARGDPGTTT